MYGKDKPISLCPLTFFRDNPELEAPAFDLHLHWTKGILPAAGGMDDQAANFGTVVVAVEQGVQAGTERLRQVAERKARTGDGANGTGPKRTRGKGRSRRR